MNYEIENMTKTIAGERPNKSLFLTKDVIAILDDMQKLWEKEK